MGEIVQRIHHWNCCIRGKFFDGLPQICSVEFSRLLLLKDKTERILPTLRVKTRAVTAST